MLLSGTCFSQGCSHQSERVKPTALVHLRLSCTMVSANLPLAKASHAATPTTIGGGASKPHPLWEEWGQCLPIPNPNLTRRASSVCKAGSLFLRELKCIWQCVSPMQDTSLCLSPVSVYHIFIANWLNPEDDLLPKL